jgi:hypothetical protein
MTKLALFSITGAFTCLALMACTKQVASSTPAGADSFTLADACRITKLINEDKWDDVEKAIDAQGQMLPILRQNASLKDWAGIGAYRGTRIDAESPLKITHRFGFAPRSNPHELWLTYTVTEKEASKPALMVMGW